MHTEAQLSALLEQLDGDGYDSIESCWESASSAWDANQQYWNINSSIKNAWKNKKTDTKTATNGNGVSLQQQLEQELQDIIAYNSKKYDVMNKSTQLLKEAVKNFNNVQLLPRNTRAKKSPEKPPEIAVMIVTAICCVYPKIAFETSQKDKSAFEYAATSGSTRILDIMLDKLLNNIGTSVTENLDSKDPSNQTQGNSTSEYVKLLLGTIAPTSHEDVRKKVTDALKHLLSKNQNLLNEATWETAITVPSPEMVEYFLNLEEPIFRTKKHAEFIVQKGTASMWNMFQEEDRRKFLAEEHCNLLHEAVSLGKVEIVKKILELVPNQVGVLTAGKEYPIQCLKKLNASSAQEKNSPFVEIRNLLVHAMIRSNEWGIQKDSKHPGNITSRSCLLLINSQAGAISFDFSQFKLDAKKESFTDYIHGLRKIANTKFFQFEQVLKYVTFPDLNGQPALMGSEAFKQDHSEVKDTLDWLRERGVEQVLSLSVDDRLYCPHDDKDVAACVKDFGVRVLKWKKLDIYLKGFSNSLIEELHLYSSGNQSVHDQWEAELPKFQKLRKLNVSVVQDLLSPARLKRVKDSLEEMLTRLNQGNRWTSDDQDDTGESNGSNDLSRFKISEVLWTQEIESSDNRSPEDITSDIVGPHLASFIKKYCGYYTENPTTKKIKVALIDSGVVVVHDKKADDDKKSETDFGSTLANRIVGGTSLVSRDDGEQTWWHATQPHGTQMATIICSINPCCDLYVVKVAESNSYGITGYNVAKAIDWARSKKVDVISLSLVASLDPDNHMAKAISTARTEDIVIICSTADEGSMGARPMNENKNEVLSIAACDSYGNLLPQSEKNEFHYQLIGENVHVGQVPYLKSDEFIGGSSVSTAIAAGLASMILACTWIASKSGDKNAQPNSDHRVLRNKIVADKFTKMCSDKKWIVLANLCRQGVLHKSPTFETLVLENFERECWE